MFYGENSLELFWSYFDDVLHRENPISREQTGCLAECEKGERTERRAEELHLISVPSP